MNYVEEYYNNYNEDGRLLRRHQSTEYLTTMRYIEKYLKPDMKILEIGAGTGRYSLTLADMGYDVTAVDLVERNVEVIKGKIKSKHNIKVYQGNALDLSFFESENFDMVLLLGPMYHFYNDEDKRRAISEAIRVAKKNAVVFVAYCNNDPNVYRVFLHGDISKYTHELDENFHTASIPSEIFELCRKEDIDRIMQCFDVKRLHYIGTDLIAPFFSEQFAEMSDEDFEKYMKFHFVLCERPDMLGFSFHLLDIFKKK